MTRCSKHKLAFKAWEPMEKCGQTCMGHQNEPGSVLFLWLYVLLEATPSH